MNEKCSAMKKCKQCRVPVVIVPVAIQYLSSDKEYLTPMKAVKREWSEERQVDTMETFYNLTYFRNNQNQMEIFWLESDTGNFSPRIWVKDAFCQSWSTACLD